MTPCIAPAPNTIQNKLSENTLSILAMKFNFLWQWNIKRIVDATIWYAKPIGTCCLHYTTCDETIKYQYFIRKGMSVFWCLSFSINTLFILNKYLENIRQKGQERCIIQIIFFTTFLSDNFFLSKYIINIAWILIDSYHSFSVHVS